MGTMIVYGTITKHGRWHVVKAPALDLHTQGRSKADALRMAAAWVRDVLDNQDIAIDADS